MARTISSGPRGMTPPQPPPVEVPRLPNLSGLVLFGRGPPSRVDFIATTNERSNSLWCLNVDPANVRTEVRQPIVSCPEYYCRHTSRT